jgi:hypothetical protein
MSRPIAAVPWSGQDVGPGDERRKKGRQAPLSLQPFDEISIQTQRQMVVYSYKN